MRIRMLKSREAPADATIAAGADGRERTPVRQLVVNTVAIVVCVLLLPVLIINCTLLVKGILSPDEVPAIFGRTPLIVLTDSMDPVIRSGDLIVCEAVEAEDVRVGDVISFFDPESRGTAVVTHRVVAIETGTGTLSFRTRGDNNDLEDRVSVPADHILGIWREDGALNQFHGLGSVVLFMQSTWGLILCLGLPLAVITAVWFVHKRRREQAQEQSMHALLAELNALKAAQAENKTSDGGRQAEPTDPSADERRE